MKVIILAAGQGTRLRPLTDDRPKCMVEIAGRSIINRILDTMKGCGIPEEDIYIVAGYKNEVLKRHLKKRRVHVLVNPDYESTNMVCSLMCAQTLMEHENDIIVSYGDIVYSEDIFKKILSAQDSTSVIVDDGWYPYWNMRNANPLDDAETLLYDESRFLTEIGQKTNDISRIQSQYIGLMRFRGQGLNDVLALCAGAKERGVLEAGPDRPVRSYSKMYMTDMLQGMIDIGKRLRAVPIDRGWFEIDCVKDLEIVETTCPNSFGFDYQLYE